MLYANEIIPQSYLDIVSKNNDWIVYEVSFDDTNWIRISPMHQEPLTETFPAKILEVNGAEIDLASAFQIHKEMVQTTDPHHLRLKITISRPIPLFMLTFPNTICISYASSRTGLVRSLSEKW